MVRARRGWALLGGVFLLALLIGAGTPMVATTDHAAAAPRSPIDRLAVPSTHTLAGHGLGVGAAWGEWPTYLADPERTGDNRNESVLAPGNASGLRVLWTAPLPGPPEDTPVVADGRVFVSSWDGNVSAYNASDGALLWRTSVGTSTFGACNFNGARGPTSTPTVQNGTVYVLGGAPELFALNESDGSVLWNVSVKVNNPSSGDYNWASPLIYGTSAYFGVASACGSPSSQGIVEQVNLNGSTHSVVHTFAVVGSGGTFGGVWSTPAVDPAANDIWVTTGDAAVGTTYGQSIVALNATDLALVGYWQVPINCCDYDFGAGPTLFHDAGGRALVAALNKNGVVYALNRSNVSSSGWGPVWRANVSWYGNTTQGQAAGPYDVAPSAFENDTLFAGGGYARLPNGTKVGGAVYGLNASTGAFRWYQATHGIVRAGLATANGIVVDAADLPNNSASFLEVRAADTGDLLFSQKVGGTINGGPSIADGMILFGNGSWSLSGPGTLEALSLPLKASAAAALVASASSPQVSFRGSATGGVPPYEFRWSFGDGGGSNGPSAPVHTYPQVGPYTAALTVLDAAGDTTSVQLAVVVPPAPITVSFFGILPSAVTNGTAVTFVTVASGGYGIPQIMYSGAPPGCGPVGAPLYSCTPGRSGAFSVEAALADGYGDSAFATANLTVTPASPPPSLVISTFLAIPSTIELGQSTSFLVDATGGSGSLHYEFEGLPPGCTSASVPVLDCPPTSPGSFEVTVTVTDSLGVAVSSSTVLNVAPAPSGPPLDVRYFSALPASIRVGDELTIVVVVAGGEAPYRYAYSGLPPGCVDENISVLTCTPTATGTFQVVGTVTDTRSQTVQANGTVTVTAAGGGAPVGTTTGSLSYLTAGLLAGGLFLVGCAVAVVALRRRPPSGPPVSP